MRDVAPALAQQYGGSYRVRQAEQRRLFIDFIGAGILPIGSPVRPRPQPPDPCSAKFGFGNSHSCAELPTRPLADGPSDDYNLYEFFMMSHTTTNVAFTATRQGVNGTFLLRFNGDRAMTVTCNRIRRNHPPAPCADNGASTWATPIRWRPSPLIVVNFKPAVRSGRLVFMATDVQIPSKLQYQSSSYCRTYTSPTSVCGIVDRYFQYLLWNSNSSSFKGRVLAGLNNVLGASPVVRLQGRAVPAIRGVLVQGNDLVLETAIVPGQPVRPRPGSGPAPGGGSPFGRGPSLPGSRQRP